MATSSMSSPPFNSLISSELSSTVRFASTVSSAALTEPIHMMATAVIAIAIASLLYFLIISPQVQ